MSSKTALGSHTEKAYEVKIYSDLKGVPSWFMNEINVGVPEDGFSISVQSSWEAPLEAGGQAINTASQLTGSDTTTQVREFNKHIWTGNDPVEVSLGLKFVTIEDPLKDVMQPAMSIFLMPLPLQGGKNEEGGSILGDDYSGETKNAVDQVTSFFLKSPVTTGFTKQGEEGQYIDVRIKDNFAFDRVLPSSADISFNSTYCKRPGNNKESWPVSAEVDFTFLASQSPVRDLGESNFVFGLSG